MLIKFGFIKKERIDNHEIFSDVRINSNKVKMHYYVSKEKSKKIIDYLKENDIGITKTQISSELNLSSELNMRSFMIGGK
ncbi:MAG: hypothetical protein ACTSR8_11375 [Promethearchaeota archaeon]